MMSTSVGCFCSAALLFLATAVLHVPSLMISFFERNAMYDQDAVRPRTPPRRPDPEQYDSPYSRGRGIAHRGALVID